MTDDAIANEDWAFERPPVVPEGVHPATLVAMEGKEATDPDGTVRKFAVWRFVVESGDEVEGTSSLTLSPRGKAYPWLVALLGAERVKTLDRLGPAERKELIGRGCEVGVKHNDAGYAKVDSVYPVRGAWNKGPAAAEDGA